MWQHSRRLVRLALAVCLRTAVAFAFVVTAQGASSADASVATVEHSPAIPAVVNHGYWLVGSDGGVFSFGSARFYGSTGSLKLQSPVVGIAATSDDGGYWLVASDGGVFAFGDATFYGSIPGLGIAPIDSPNPHRLNGAIVGIVASHDDRGYFLVASDGGVFAFGDAQFEGSCPASTAGCPTDISALMTDATGEGYWVLSPEGDVYAYGDAVNYGQPAADLPYATGANSGEATPSGNGYWILFSDGEIYTYGDAGYFGSPFGQIQFSNPAMAIFATADGNGYWVVSAFGAVYPFGDAPNDGGLTSTHLNGSIVGATGW
jgi:hypothetical protein